MASELPGASRSHEQWLLNFRHISGVNLTQEVKPFETCLFSLNHGWVINVGFPSNTKKISLKLVYVRGLTEENTQSGIISLIKYLKFPIGFILSNWGLGICSLLYMTHKSPIPNWVHNIQLGI